MGGVDMENEQEESLAEVSWAIPQSGLVSCHND